MASPVVTDGATPATPPGRIGRYVSALARVLPVSIWPLLILWHMRTTTGLADYVTATVEPAPR